MQAFDQGDPLQAGVTMGPAGCRVVMNRAVLRSVFDGLLLGANCWAWYGARSMTDSSRLFGNFQHASPLAVDVLVLSHMQEHYEAYRRTLAELQDLTEAEDEDDEDEGAPAPLDVAAASVPLLAEMRRQLAALFFYVFSTTPYLRTTPTAGLALHHAMWLAAVPAGPRREKALLCIPMLVPHLLVDYEVMSLASRDEFVERGWWQFFDGAAADMLPCLSRVLGAGHGAGAGTARPSGRRDEL